MSDELPPLPEAVWKDGGIAKAVEREVLGAPDMDLFWDKVVAWAKQNGYRFTIEETETDIIQRMIRPDGTVAVQARRKK